MDRISPINIHILYKFVYPFYFPSKIPHTSLIYFKSHFNTTSSAPFLWIFTAPARIFDNTLNSKQQTEMRSAERE